MLRRIIIIGHKTIDCTAAIVSLIMFLICLYAMIDAYNVYEGANDTSLLKYKSEKGAVETLRELSADAVAWITVDNTRIDYPVMQGKTNGEYLNKNPYGEFSLSGSIFLDSRNNKGFEDEYSMIYGHHMEHGAMFGSLDGYSDKDYFDSHKTGILSVINQKEYSISFFASCKAMANDDVIFDPSLYEDQALFDYLQKKALVYYPQEVSAGSKIIALSTCQSAENNERMVVFGTLLQK